LRVALRQKLKRRAVKQRLADSKTELSSISRLQQQRVAGEKGRALADLRPLAARTHNLLTPRKVSELLQARLDSARLRARKALL
jgi:hypothetical protein